MASLHAVILVLSMYSISPGLRPICHAVIMQFRCIISAIRSGGYARAVQIECSHGASRLMRLVQLGAFCCWATHADLRKPGVWRSAAFCSARPDRPALTHLAAAMPPGSSASPGSRSPCAGQPADGATRQSPDGITATRDSALSRPDRSQQEMGNTCNRTRLTRPHRPRGCALMAETRAVIPDGRHFS
jgi:hypothetical protein